MSLIHFATISPTNKIEFFEVETTDPGACYLFNLTFNFLFLESSLSDIPVVNGIQEFVDEDGNTVLVATNFSNLTCVCADRLNITA